MSFGFSGRNAGFSVRRILEEPEAAFKALCWTAEMYQWSPMPFTPGHTVWEVLDFGGTARMPAGEYEGTLIMKTHPVETEKDVETLSLPDPYTAGRIPFARRFAELAREQGFPVFFSSRSPFTIAANLCGLENFCRWLMKKPELCRQLMALALAHLFHVLDYWIELFGAQDLWGWMSNPNEANQLFSAGHVAAFAMPFHQEFHRGLKERGIQRFGFHLCGDQNANLPYFAEAALWPPPASLVSGTRFLWSRPEDYFRRILFLEIWTPTCSRSIRPRGFTTAAGKSSRRDRGPPAGSSSPQGAASRPPPRRSMSML
jgi:uroporphyrinogen decarboxylase